MKNLNLRIFLNSLPIQIALFLTLSIIFWGGESRAQTDSDKRSEESISQKTEPTPNPQLTEKQKAEIRQIREEFMASPDAACSATAPIGFSVLGQHDYSGINDTVLQYNKNLNDKIITNSGLVWNKPGSMFIVPCDGLYYMTISFVKDTYDNGTLDDVWMYFAVYPATGNKIQIPGVAWAGEQATQSRSTGTYSVVYRLKQGDIVQTWTFSDGLINQQFKRHLLQYSFSGFLIAP